MGMLFPDFGLWAKDHSPNIVLINVDDLGWKDLGVYGSNFYQTPNIDQLAQSGMLFTQAYAAASNCAPSRACMLTGLQTPRHGIYTVSPSSRGNSKDRKLIPVENTMILNDSFTTIAEMLKVKNYHSISIGKWHVGNDPTTQGFDENIGGSKAGYPKTYFSPYKNVHLSGGPDGEYLTDRLTDEAIKFISRNQENRFFLYMPFYSVHTPLMAKKEKTNKYANRAVTGQGNATYAAMIESVDENVGRLLNTLTTFGLIENTLIIFTSDNGGICHISSQRPLRAGKGSYYEGGVRVPLIFSWPGKIKKGSICEQVVSNLDFFPTLLDLVDAEHKSNYSLDGISLLPILLYGEVLPERPIFWHFPIYLESYAGSGDEARDTLFRTRPGTAMRLGNWKLHEYFEDGDLELYQLALDPTEQKNVRDLYPEIRDSLHHLMQLWRNAVNAPVPTELNQDFDPQ